MSLEQRIQNGIDCQIEWLRNDILRKMRSTLYEVNLKVEKLPVVKYLGETENEYLPAVIPSPFKYCDFYCGDLGLKEAIDMIDTQCEHCKYSFYGEDRFLCCGNEQSKHYTEDVEDKPFFPCKNFRFKWDSILDEFRDELSDTMIWADIESTHTAVPVSTELASERIHNYAVDVLRRLIKQAKMLESAAEANE